MAPRRVVLAWLAACALCTGLVLTASPALASPISDRTGWERTVAGQLDGLRQARSGSSSHWYSPVSSVGPSGFSAQPLPDSCTSQGSLPPECTAPLLLATLEELREQRTFLTVAASLTVALLGALLILLVGRP